MNKKRIYHLVYAEDSEADIDLFKFALNKTNEAQVELVILENGEELLKYLKKEPPYENGKVPDLILLDINMPKKNGLEALEEIKKSDQLKMIPVLMLTCSNNNKDVLLSYKSHANSYILKPHNINDFINVIKSIKEHWFKSVKLPTSVG